MSALMIRESPRAQRRTLAKIDHDSFGILRGLLSRLKVGVVFLTIPRCRERSATLASAIADCV